MTDSGDFKEIVKQQADIVRVVGDYVKLKKAGSQNYSGLCPFHNEKTPSFSVHATRQFFHCFGCGVSGDVFSFVQKIENITFPEAVRAVAQKLGIALPKIRQRPKKPSSAPCCSRFTNGLARSSRNTSGDRKALTPGNICRAAG